MTGLTEHIPAVSEQARLFLMSVLMGLPAGVLLDAFRLLRALLPHCAAAVFLEDACYVFCMMLMHQCFAVMFMHGSLRAYPAFGILLGLAFYLLTAGVFTGRLFRRIRLLSGSARSHLRQKQHRIFDKSAKIKAKKQKFSKNT